MKKKIKKIQPNMDPIELRKALYRISVMGNGMKPDIVDWISIGKNAKSVALEALSEVCLTCNKKK